MYKVYSQQAPNIVMEGSNNTAYFSGELEAVESNGKITIRKLKQNDRLVAEEIAHTEFADEDGNSFGTLQETIDELNVIYNDEYNSSNGDIYIVATGLGYTGSRREWDILYKTRLVKLILNILL